MTAKKQLLTRKSESVKRRKDEIELRLRGGEPGGVWGPWGVHAK
jgi:hypothetical protein